MRLIDVNETYELARTNSYYSDFHKSMADLTSLKELLEDAPTVDAAPVVHGRWITDKNGVTVCSNCGEEHEWDEYRPTYCEDCGAKMDRKEKE